MDVYQAMAKRRSIRKYKAIPIEEDKLNRILESLRMAPSGNNSQPVRFVLLTKPEDKKRLVEQACNQDFIKNAAVVVVACCLKSREFDAAIAMDHLSLAAAAEGIGTCWVRWFDKAAAGLVVGAPADYEVAVLMPMGYADEDPAPKPRLPLSELIRYGKF